MALPRPEPGDYPTESGRDGNPEQTSNAQARSWGWLFRGGKAVQCVNKYKTLLFCPLALQSAIRLRWLFATAASRFSLHYASLKIYFTMTRLATRAQHRAAREASSSPVCAAARRAQTVSSARSGARRAKSPPAVRASSEPPSLVRLLCLRCAKYSAKNPSSLCSFDKESSDKCSRCRSQKSKCLHVNISSPLPIPLPTWVAPILPGLTWP